MSAPYIQANTNGRLHPATEPSLAPLDRGFLYGDAIYEVWRTYDGHLFSWHEHFDRLEESARALHLPIPRSRDEILTEIRRTVAAFRQATGFEKDVYIRLQITRGAGPIGLDTALAEHPSYVLLVQPCPLLSERHAATGLKLSIAGELRRNPIESLSPAWKTGNYLNNLLALREARSRGADDVVILNLRGEITEASTANIAFVRDGEVFTPPLSVGILSGITRRFLIANVAGFLDVPIREQILTPTDLPTMQECFLLASTRDVVPVGAIDSMPYAVGPGTLTTRLKAAFREQVRQSLGDRPELKI